MDTDGHTQRLMKKFQQEIDEYLIERDWKGRTTPDYVAKSLVIEAVELLECFQKQNWTRQEILADSALRERIADELGDVIILAAQMATFLDGDLLEFARAKAEKVKKKYPADAVKGNDDAYDRIKMEHRENRN